MTESADRGNRSGCVKRIRRRSRVESLERRVLLNGALLEYTVPEFPDQLAPGPQDKMWFIVRPTPSSGSTIGNWELGLIDSTGNVSTFPANPGSVVSDSQGNAWATEGPGGTIDRVTPSGSITHYTFPGTGALSRGPDGNIWSVGNTPSNGFSDHVISIAPDGTLTSIPLDQTIPTVNRTLFGSDGNLWATTSTQLVKITPAGKTTIFPVPGNTTPLISSIAVGSDGNFWFTDQNNFSIDRMTPAGVVTSFSLTPLLPAANGAFNITAGPDGALWVTEFGHQRIGRMTTSGVYSDFPLPSHGTLNPNANGVAPYGIATDGSGIWFSEQGSAYMDRLDVSQSTLINGLTALSPVPGQSFNGIIASFTNTTPGLDPSTISVPINWGDGTSSMGTVVAAGSGVFNVIASHPAWTTQTRYNLSLSIDTGNGVLVQTAEQYSVGYPITVLKALNWSGKLNQSVSAPLVGFMDANPLAIPAQFTATIHWGDGFSAAGTISTDPATGAFIVSGKHTYATVGQFPISVQISDAGASASTTQTATLLAPEALAPALSNSAAVGFLTGDVNGDGIPDLIYAAKNIQTWLGNGDGTFKAGVSTGTLETSLFIRSAAAGDFNNDGKADVVISYWVTAGNGTTTTQMDCFLGDGAGGFTLAGHVDNVPEGTILTADLNHDGNLDLVMTEDSSTVAVLLGHGDGTFTKSQFTAPGQQHAFPVLADVNGDNVPDLILDAGGLNEVLVLDGNGNGTFQPAVAYSYGLVTAGSIAAADFNGDGKLDLAVLNSSGLNNISILLNNGDGTFAAPIVSVADPSVPTGTQSTAPNDMVAIDLNGDGRADLARVDATTRSIDVQLSVGDGTFLPPDKFNISANTAALNAVVAADFNHDGLMDVAALSTSGGVSVLLDTTATPHGSNVTALQAAAGNFTVATVTPVNSAALVPSQFSGTINWGDGTTSPAVITAGSSGSLNIGATHTYAVPQSYTITTTISGPPGGSFTVTATATVNDLPLTSVSGRNFPATVSIPTTALLATFTDPAPTTSASLFSATIAWGDGTTSSGSVIATGSNSFNVYGTHTYARAGLQAVSISIVEQRGSANALTTFVNASAIVTNGDPNLGEISGTVYNDSNYDGVRQFSETGLSFETVYLDANGNGTLDAGEPSVLSASDGSYVLAGVAPGTWAIRQVPIGGYRLTAPPPGGSLSVTLATNQIVTGADFGNGVLDTAGFSGTSGDDSMYIRMNPDGTNMDVWVNSPQPGAGTPTFSPSLAYIGDVFFSPLAGNDSLTVDLTGGPFPFNGKLHYDGGTGNNTLSVIGTTASETFTIDSAAQTMNFAGIAGTLANVSSITYTDGGGNDTVAIAGPVPFTLIPGDGTDTLSVAVGAGATVNFGPSNGSMTIVNDGNVVLNFGSGSPALAFAAALPAAPPPAPTPAPRGIIRGRIFNDANADGVLDTNERGLPGRQVYLDLNRNGKLDAGEPTARTDAAGNYLFTGLGAGNYRVREVALKNWRETERTSGYYDLKLKNNQSLSGNDFAQTQLALIHGVVFRDLNGDGRQSAGEKILSGWLVFDDTNGNGKLDKGEARATTDSSGRYALAMAAGTHHLRVVLKPGFSKATSSAGNRLALAAAQVVEGINLGVR